MDQMLPSPYNIPGIGTPLHQPEEDQQILPNAMQQQQQQQMPTLESMGSSPLVGFGSSIMSTTRRIMPTDAPTVNYATPQQMMQPQTPQNVMSPMVNAGSLAGQQMLMQASTAPMTPLSADPGILPQLQNIVNLGCRLDLKKVALNARNAEYNPKRFAAVIMRI